MALLVRSGRPLSGIASELGISPSMLRNWCNGSAGRDAIAAHTGRNSSLEGACQELAATTAVSPVGRERPSETAAMTDLTMRTPASRSGRAGECVPASLITP